MSAFLEPALGVQAATGREALSGDPVQALSPEDQDLLLHLLSAPPDPGLELGLHEELSESLPLKLGSSVGQARSTTPKRLGLTESPLSYAQQRLWIFDQVHPGTSTHTVPWAVRLRGALNRQVLEQTLVLVQQRHPSLRARFVMRASKPGMASGMVPVTVTDVHLAQQLPFLDLRNQPVESRESIAHQQVLAAVAEPFDLTLGPLFRTLLVQLADQEHILVLCMHHIVTDGWSINLLWKELNDTYSRIQAGQSVPPPKKGIDYADYAFWQREHLAVEGLREGLVYWTRTLADYDGALDLPKDRCRPSARHGQGASVIRHLSPELTRVIRSYSRSHGLTVFFTLLAVFQVFLRHLTQRDDIAVATPVSGRTLAEVEDIVGFFVNLVVIRTRPRAELSFAEFVQQVRAAALDAFAHQEVPFEAVVAELNPRREGEARPLAEVSFGIWQDAMQQDAEFTGMEATAYDLDLRTADGTLTLMCTEQGSHLILHAEYNADLFEPATIERWVDQLLQLTARALADDTLLIRDLTLLSDADQQALLAEFSTGQLLASKTPFVHVLFEQQARQHADATALAWPENGSGDSSQNSSGDRLGSTQRLTYKSLNRQANALAERLIAAGVCPDDRVATLFDDGVLLVISFLAILKAGGVYVPIDPAYPAERVHYLAADASPVVVLTHSPYRDVLSHVAAPVWVLDPARKAGPSARGAGTSVQGAGAPSQAACATTEPTADDLPTRFDRNPDPAELGLRPNHVAYIIYTSGSTGRPKGVMNHHAGLSNLAQAQAAMFATGPNSRVIRFAPQCFDASVWELVMALGSGASIYVPGSGRPMAGDVLAETMREQAITHITLPPSALMLLREEDDFGQLTMVIAGEKFPVALAQRWAGRARVFNAYGPTETTVCASVFACEGDYSDAVPIGSPFPNSRLYLLDTALSPVPVGVVGEIYIGGTGVARGYQRRPDLTAAAFLPDSFSATPGDRMYRTGDLAFWQPDGNLAYIGREDFQAKVRGHRIEPSEIDVVLAAHPQVAESVTLAEEDVIGSSRLLTFVVARAGRSTDSAILRDYLRSRLPSYMVPGSLQLVQAIPRNASGKTDRFALLALRSNAPVTGPDQALPQNALQRSIIEVWKSVLGFSRVGLDDNLFDLGGHSLSAVQIRDELVRRLGTSLEVLDLFAHPTVRTLAKHLDRGNVSSPAAGEMEARSLHRRRYLNARAQKTTN